MQAAEILRKNSKEPLHRWPDEDLQKAWVSSTSRWTDSRWYFDDPTPGTGRETHAKWDIELENGENLMDAKYTGMLSWLRRFFWTLHEAPGDRAAAAKPRTLASYSAGLATLVPWMVEQHVFWPHELTQDVLDSYVDDLPAILTSKRGSGVIEGQKITASAAYRAVVVVYRIWQQRKVLEQSGIRPMPARPWSECKGANSVARQVATEQIGWIQPLPDEVAVPLLNRSIWFLGAPADDLLRLREAMDGAYHRPAGNYPTGPGTALKACEIRQRKVCREWSFTAPSGQDRSWHPPLKVCGVPPVQRALQLIKSLQSAAMIAIQGFAGLRVSELCGLPAGIDANTKLPKCIECRPSPSGLNDVFILRTELSKTEESPRNVEWQVGLRPVGSSEIPIVVQAILLLERLLAPYRGILGSDRLLVSLSASRGLPKTSKGVQVMTIARVLTMYKDFIEQWVDLSKLPDESAHPTQTGSLTDWRESKGRIITTHQLRKTFALYVLSADSRLLPAVKRHFHHVSLAMTESGYWGRNPDQIEPVKSVSAQQTALMMYELATGRTKVAGIGGERLEAGAKELRMLLEGLNLEQGWRKTVRWVREKGIDSVFAPHGGCAPLATSEMECWKKAGARPLGHQYPNYSTRDPGVCAGCRSFWMDARHIPMWEQRYIQNEVAYRDAVSRGRAESFRRIRFRAKQAAALLRSVGFDLSGADQKINQELASGNAA